jgi:protein-tyrosine phosphatase
MGKQKPTLARRNVDGMLQLPTQRLSESPLNKKKAFLGFIAIVAVIAAAVRLAPGPALIIPAELPAEQRASHRVLNFDGIKNFRDLGGYPTADGRQVKWGVLYRSANLAHSSSADLQGLKLLHLKTLVDFRSSIEKQEEPNRLPKPPGFRVVAVPTLDDGNNALAKDIRERLENGNFDGFDPNALMLDANRQFATQFTPQFRQFIQEVQAANGAPILWHCTAGKDRTGFAAAILLRILGVPQDTVMQDYLASKQYALDERHSQLLLLRVFKGEAAADKMAVLMGVEAAWLTAAFEQIDSTWGSFDNYVHQGLGLSDQDIAQLKASLLTAAPTVSASGTRG